MAYIMLHLGNSIYKIGVEHNTTMCYIFGHHNLVHQLNEIQPQRAVVENMFVQVLKNLECLLLAAFNIPSSLKPHMWSLFFERIQFKKRHRSNNTEINAISGIPGLYFFENFKSRQLLKVFKSPYNLKRPLNCSKHIFLTTVSSIYLRK